MTGGQAMDAARMRTRLRGWGGVGAMAVLCALALAFVLLLPRTQAHPAA
ncbi:sugar-binding protein, partial [Streptomyces sp. SID2999]|nr:sugar-binding protein [Streptomyces sp. SID2999]